jgi:hypothetical protein
MKNLLSLETSVLEKAFDEAYLSMNWDTLHPFMELMKLDWYKNADSAKEMANRNFRSLRSYLRRGLPNSKEKMEASVSSGCVKVKFKLERDVLVCRIVFDARIGSSSYTYIE